ncbi:ATP synthase mitochondrial F1 complex assembly factor 1 [Microcaecilia unicolor]|uniref:ATP synthase mitochondrial F1 complex assembly factor 1 n=1 Tax=Microcaecilia unicolor TaxID=1415580 RepID=A0A6P7YFY4_9AMPH|nr:ATP synthase mitochondrial F1 complex assembly factor 1 [Microcaecilia unicolor]
MCEAEQIMMAAAVLQMRAGYTGLLAVRSRHRSPLALGVVSPQLLREFTARKEPELEENPYYAKYREKIQELRRSSPAVYDARMEKRSEVKRQPLGHSKQADFVRIMEQKAETSAAQGSGGRSGFTKDKALSSVLNIDMVKHKTAEEIKEIWKHYFSMKDTVFAVIPGDVFDLMWDRAKTCSSFLYAVPRQEGYEFFVGQWSGLELHFTSVINIQTARDAAPSQLVLYHYRELQEEKGIVLMTAEVDSRFLNVLEAQCLANQVQLFYATHRPETYRLVEMFNHSPDEFKYMMVISEMEQSGLGKQLRLSHESTRDQKQT